MDPITLATAALNFATALIENDTKRRDTMSQSARDEADRIQAQAYWDVRAVLEWAKLVGPPR